MNIQATPHVWLHLDGRNKNKRFSFTRRWRTLKEPPKKHFRLLLGALHFKPNIRQTGELEDVVITVDTARRLRALD
jgi:hypothetical protein